MTHIICNKCGRVYENVVLPLICGCRSKVNKITGGPGTELYKLIPKMFEVPGCDCRTFANKMDRWGIDGCQARFNRIVKRLVVRSQRKQFIKYFPSISEIIIKQLLAKAIDNAKKNTIPSKCTIVWVYWAAGAEGDELRYSIRSAVENVSNIHNIVICGDKPSWYKGDHIPSPKFTKRQARKKYGTERWAKWVDSIIKLQRIIDSPLVTDNFLWMYDDTFIVKPTSFEWLAAPRSGGTMRPEPTPSRKTWRECIRRTANCLQNHNLPLYNYSTHFPVVYEKGKLKETLDKFRPDQAPRVIESLYLNHHFPVPHATVQDVFQYNKNIPESWRINPNVTVVNVGGFKTPVACAMMERFPTPCYLEKE